MKLEQEVDQLIILEAAKYGVHLWRNNSGMLYNSMGTPVRFGLGNDSAKRNEVMKSSDRIGPTPVIITQSMVGQLIGVFTAVESKSEDWKYTGTPREVAQKNFIDIVLKNGGYAGFANSVDQFRKIIRR